jgi:hypothetical protein
LKKIIIAVLVFVLNWNGLIAQISIHFNPLFGDENLKLNERYYTVNKNDSLLIETLKFYISNIELLQNNQPVFKEKNSFHLVDLSEIVSLNFVLPTNIIFDQIKFNLGIDSVTNYNGAMGGDLDPTKGMYWTWQNGYINFKIEGKSNLCINKNKEFIFHLGGFEFPYNSLQTIQLKIENKSNIDVNLDLKKWFNQIDLRQQDKLMSPGNEAILLSNKLAPIFSVSK